MPAMPPHRPPQTPLQGPALLAMPWLLAVAAGILYLATRLEAHTFTAFQMAFSARMAPTLADCLLHPGFLLYPHALRLLMAPARLAGVDADAVLFGQILSAACAAATVGVVYRLLSSLVDNWRCALLAAGVFGASYTVWFSAAEPLAHAPAMLLGGLALLVIWRRRASPPDPLSTHGEGGKEKAARGASLTPLPPSPRGGEGGAPDALSSSASRAPSDVFEAPSLSLCILAGVLAGAAALLDLGAVLWAVPLGMAAGLLGERGRRGRWIRVAAAGGIPLAVAGLGLWLAWGATQTRLPGLPLRDWLALALPREASGGAWKHLFLYFKTFKFALLYRTPWYVGLPISLGFAGIPWAWRQRRRETLIFGLCAAGGAVRALGAAPVEIHVWAPAMPGVAGLLALSLDSLLRLPRMRRLKKATILAGGLVMLVLIGDNRGWLWRFEGVGGFRESEAAVDRLAKLSASPGDVFFVPPGYLGFMLPYRHGLRNVIEPQVIESVARAEGRDEAEWAADAASDALGRGDSVFVDEQYLQPGSEMYRSGVIRTEVAEALKRALPGPGEAPEGFQAPFVFRRWGGSRIR